MRRVLDLGRAARLLSAEIVRRDADDHQAALVVALPQLLQAGILRGVAALRGGVDHEDRLAGIVRELDVAALSAAKENA